MKKISEIKKINQEKRDKEKSVLKLTEGRKKQGMQEEGNYEINQTTMSDTCEVKDSRREGQRPRR